MCELLRVYCAEFLLHSSINMLAVQMRLALIILKCVSFLYSIISEFSAPPTFFLKLTEVKLLVEFWLISSDM